MVKEITGSKKWLILIITSVSTFMATLDSSIVNIALPVISSELKVSINQIQWVVTSYLLTISLLLLVWGKLSDLYGKKKIFSTGFLVFALGSAMCGFSHTLQFLVISRIIQAVGASAMMSLSQGIVTGTFPSQERGRALGFVGTMVALGNLAGPSIGGVLVHFFNWQTIFFINVPIGIFGLIFSFLIIPEIFETQDVKYFDYKGAILFSLALLVLFLSLLFVQEGTIPPAYLIPALIITAAALYIFIRVEKKSTNPLIDPGLFKIHEFSYGLTAAFLSFLALNSVLLFMPFYLQNLLKFNSLHAGIIISIYPLTTAVIAPISGWLSDKLTYRPLTITGMAAATLALLLLATLHKNSPVWEIVLLLSLLGFGIATFQSPNNSSIMGSVNRNQLGIAGGINALFRNLGLVSGTAFSVLIYSFAARSSINSLSGGGLNSSSFIKGFSYVMLFNAVCTAAAVFISIKRAVGKGKKAEIV
ncbi:MAG TPA: MFS transporter [Ruminiclostridium sp.]|nr:MFS transporter [Ruminiclostridium sp.]